MKPGNKTFSLLILIGAVFLLSLPVRAADDVDKAEVLRQAGDFFKRANDLLAQDPAAAAELFNKSLLRYQSLVRAGVRSGKLYYNIGNVYFRLNDIGRALLNYRRAELYIPDDPNLRQNISYAISKRQDRIKERQRKEVLKTLFFWHYDLAGSAKAIIFAVFYLFFWLAAVLKMFRPRPYLNWCLGVSMSLFILFLGSLLIDRFIGAKTRGVLLDQEVIARKGDGLAYKPSFKDPLHAGVDFYLLENRGQWLHIELADGRQCWVPARSAGLVRKRGNSGQETGME